MKAFDCLLEVADILNGPQGCPWDHKQTFFSLQPYLLEEAHEVVEAVDGQKDSEIIEELGDLLYVVIFYAKIAEKEQRFSLEQVLDSIRQKLIRRHPHVFGSRVIQTEEDLMQMWGEIKKSEEGKTHRKSELDAIVDTLPILTKAQKMIKLFKKTGFLAKKEDNLSLAEKDVAQSLWDLIVQAQESGVDVEGAFRRRFLEEKEAFMDWEVSVH